MFQTVRSGTNTKSFAAFRAKLRRALGRHTKTVAYVGDSPTLYLNATQLDWLCRDPDTSITLPAISKAQFDDMSKGDFFVKGTAIVEVSWLFATIIVRAAKAMPIAQLEIGVLAFAVCTFIAYLFFWYKPQDVKVAMPIYISRPLLPETIDRLSQAEFFGQSAWAQLFSMTYDEGSRSLESPTPNDNFPRDMTWTFEVLGGITYPHFFTVTVAAGMIFRSIRCFAWNFHFPTQIKRTIWRASSLFVAASPLAFLVAMVTADLTRFAMTCAKVGDGWKWLLVKFYKYFAIPLTGLYVIARLFFTG